LDPFSVDQNAYNEYTYAKGFYVVVLKQVHMCEWQLVCGISDF